MTSWYDRSHEERHLLNPAFCSTLIWHAAIGATEYQDSSRSSLSYMEAFLILPITLHQRTRESLPARVNSSLPVWINENPLVMAGLPARLKSLVPHTKEALFFGAVGDLFQFEGDHLKVNVSLKSDIATMLCETSDEVQQCNKKARFLGKWFKHTGLPETIFTLLGIRP